MVYRGKRIPLVLIQNIDCGYSLEPPWQGGSKSVPTIYVLSKIRKLSIFLLKIFNLYSQKKKKKKKNLNILHGQVFVMETLVPLLHFDIKLSRP